MAINKHTELRKLDERKQAKRSRVEWFRSQEKWILFVACCFRISLFSGSMKCNGVILDDLVEQLDTNHSLIAWAFSLQSGLTLMLTPVTRMLLTLVSHRKLSITGGFLAGAGYIYCGLFAYSVAHVFVGYTLSGMGFSLAMLPNYLALQKHFKDNFPTASSVTSLFNFVGMSLLPPVMKLIEKTYGLNNSLILLGALLWNVIPCGFAVKLPREKTDPQPIVTKSEEPIANDNAADDHDVMEAKPDVITVVAKERTTRSRKYFSFCSSLNAHKNFSILFIFSVVCCYVYTSWVIFLVSFGTATGITDDYAVLLSTAGGIGGLAGKLIGAILFHLRKVNAFVCCVPIVFTGLFMLICIFTRNFYVISSLIFMSGITQGLNSGVLYGSIPLIVCSYHFAQAIALLSFVEGIAIQCSGIFSGLIHDVFGSSIYVFGFNSILCFAVAPLMFLWICNDQDVRDCKEDEKKRPVPSVER